MPKDAYNQDKGIRRLEKAYKRGAFTKDNINKRGYNKFLRMEGDVSVSINYDKLEADAQWDGLKGYLTNTDIPVSDVYTAYHNLWKVENKKTFLSKSGITESGLISARHLLITISKLQILSMHHCLH